VPDSLEQVDKSICNKIFKCSQTRRPFKIIEPELLFYKKNLIPLPELCPDVRHQMRLQQRNPRFLWDRECSKCETAITTAYAPSRPERVLCESCYSDEVYI